ncbi:hypothetical protein GN244_ATG06397 [Phytophthora infestans]|uniref:Uncharacterized protein n=1 Tax=Phytophthora infestans TaxID=4787 RepID=A0A833TEP9_PHYIN|nr:hypothetical protein GN244_ATG06397 [Phytophthora infestans]
MELQSPPCSVSQVNNGNRFNACAMIAACFDADYVLNFESQIFDDCAGYTIAYDLTGNCDDMYPVVSEYLNDRPYPTFTRKGSASTTLAYGYDCVNVENAWYPIEIRTNFTTDNIMFSINKQLILTKMGFMINQLSFCGYASHGEGAIALVSLVRGALLELEDREKCDPSLADLHPNTYGLRINGAKRNRFMWLGSFYHHERNQFKSRASHWYEAVVFEC